MKTNIFIPTKINVGFRERNDTYTKKLAYVIYFDEKGKLRKETSWNGWRDEKIDNEIYENEPTSGFVLNKKAGGYSTGWNHRQTYVRVYDPRGFEFEITVPNLLYILENTSSIIGKGLEGDFVYGWDGKDLILMPVSSPDYVEISELNKLRHAKNFVKAKDLKVGATYLNKDGRHYVYMGKFDEYGWREKKKTKAFFFYSRNGGFETMRTTSQRLVDTVSEECVEDFAELFDKLESSTMYSPIDHSLDEYIPYTLEELDKKFNWSWAYVYKSENQKIYLRKENDGRFWYEEDNPKYEAPTYSYYYGNRGGNGEPRYIKHEYKDIHEVIEKLKPLRQKVYLANGKVYSEGY